METDASVLRNTVTELEKEKYKLKTELENVTTDCSSSQKALGLAQTEIVELKEKLAELGMEREREQ